jgi:hypothetical protein
MNDKSRSALALIFIAMTCAATSAEEKIGKTSQPLVGGAEIDQQTRRELGLLTLDTPTGTCSASLLNEYWALTAAHCIEDMNAPRDVTLIASWWPGEQRPATELRSFKWTHNLDIALVQIGRPFKRENIPFPQISHRPTSDLHAQRIEAVGTGINTLAWRPPGAMAVPTQSDDKFRSGEFEVHETSSSEFSYRGIEGAGTTLAGGDSGGPSYFRVWDDHSSPYRKIVRLIAGVHSNCQAQCLDGQTCEPGDWTWISSVSTCTDASVEPIRNEIAAIIRHEPELPYAEKPLDPDLVIADEKPYDERPPDTDIVVKEEEKPFVERRSDIDVIAGPSVDVVERPSDGLVAAATIDPNTCKSGFVWRAARPDDLVCVPPEARDRTAQENADAPARVDPAGAYGPNTCIQGFVWREAFPGDLVCVTPDTRDRVAEENQLAPTRRAGG